MSSLLEARQITKKFSGVTALEQVDLRLEAGKVTALIGENGAGKSTLLKIMSGIYTDYEGSIVFRNQQIRFSSPKDAQDLGISIIHQELNLMPYLTVAQNIFLGRELLNRFGFLDQEAMNRQSRELLQRLQLQVEPTAQLSSLKVGQQQLIEIAKALLVESEVVFMDEPTSAIGESEVELLFKIINQLKKDGKAIVYISHKLEELFAIADRFVVLRDGRVVGEGEMKEITRDELIALMAGRDISRTPTSGEVILEETMLQVQNLSLRHPAIPQAPILDKINFHLRKGEILGLYGLMGAGRTELCESLFGLHHPFVSGRIELEGRQMTFERPLDAIEAGMALVPEDRKKHGIVPGMSVAKNMSLTVIDKILSRGFLSKQLESKLFQKQVAALNIKVHSPSQLIRNLSGGNQQKVVLAKWLERSPKVLLLDEPTRGIDINAKHDMYELITELAGSGMSILLASSEIPEILAVSHRVLVMADGQITADFSREEASETNIMNACIPETTSP